MGFFEIFRKNKKDVQKDRKQEQASKEDIIHRILEKQANESPSKRFASGAVFDIVRQNRMTFLQSIQAKDVLSLKMLFVNSYMSFLANPEIVGLSPNMMNNAASDTDPQTWNVDIVRLPNGNDAALLFIPIQNDEIEARIVGIVFDDNEDGYYYCMLNKDESKASIVYRNCAWQGIRQIKEINGRGFELMNKFADCISIDFCSL